MTYLLAFWAIFELSGTVSVQGVGHGDLWGVLRKRCMLLGQFGPVKLKCTKVWDTRYEALTQDSPGKHPEVKVNL